ncbi:O-antigen ligase family protein [Salinarimonas rosea]|uniref:O-antigen ligase family protein n=1 Tax=Salinarimonas rosea TaxID=552063 RepID=UPI0004166E0C|nr:O-antigen ligase family protein [Salinarimonas rosea]
MTIGQQAAMTAPPRRDGTTLAVSLPQARVLLATVVLTSVVLLPFVGRIAVLAFLAAGAGLVLLALDRLRAHATDVGLFLLPCVVALVSAVGSLHPQQTLWYGGQYTVSAIVLIALALSIAPLVAMRLASLAIALGLGLSLAFPTYHYVGHTGEIAFVGIFSSKNYYSFVVGTLVILGAGQCAAGGKLGRSFGFACVVIGFAFLLLGRSLGAIVGTTATLAVAGAFVATRVLDRSVLAPTLVLCVALAAAAGVWLVAEFDLVARQMAAVGRDPTLTGRTILWELAWENFQASPLLGTGYRGFFVPYYPPATEVLELFRLPPDAAWNYHNAFFQVLAGTGVLGVAAHALLLARILGLFVAGIARNRLRAADAGIVAAFSYLALRSVLEVDFTQEYGLGLFLYALVLAALVQRAAAPARGSRLRDAARRRAVGAPLAPPPPGEDAARGQRREARRERG